MNLLIIGAGGHGQCCYEIASRMNIYDKISFLDDNSQEENVIGHITELDKFVSEYEHVFIAIGNNQLRKVLFNKAKELSYTLATLIDPKASVSSRSYVGQGCVIFPCAVVETNSYVSNGCIISSNTTINHDARIDEFVLVYSNAVVRPRAHIKELCVLQSRCLISSDVTIEANTNVNEGSIVSKEEENV